MTTVFLFAASLVATGVPDTVKTTVSGQVIAANVGFAPVPAFSFDAPIVMGFATISRKRFLYEPDLSVGFNGKPWMMNNWLRYKFVDRPRTNFRIGVNPNLFFKQDIIVSGEEMIQAQRAFVSEVGADRNLGGKWNLSLAYQYIHGVDPGTLRGSFIAATLSTPSIPIFKKLSINLKPQVTHFDFTYNLGGTLFSTTALLMHERIPVSLYFQGVVPVWLKFESEFKWNYGLVYIF